MSAKVYFADFKATSDSTSTVAKVRKLFEKADLGGVLGKDDLTAVKVHFGERGNDGFISPVYVRQVVDKIKERRAKPFVTDTNTLYIGERHNAVDHLNVALEHGFGYAAVGAPLVIADGLKSGGFMDVDVDLKHFKSVKIAGDIMASDSMIVLSHTKGHPMAGFGGAIKNLAMGCAPAAGKKDQHSFRPEVDQSVCAACGKCGKVCPADAISFGPKARIDRRICIGCGDCVSECPVKAISVEEENGEMTEFVERMTEYAKGAVLSLRGKVGYMNFLMRITPDCDCFGFSDRSIVPDIGILAGLDPVAIDQASMDLISAETGFANSRLKDGHKPGCDKFAGLRPTARHMVQVEYGERIGLGTRKYELVKI